MTLDIPRHVSLQGARSSGGAQRRRRGRGRGGAARLGQGGAGGMARVGGLLA